MKKQNIKDTKQQKNVNKWDDEYVKKQIPETVKRPDAKEVQNAENQDVIGILKRAIGIAERERKAGVINEQFWTEFEM